MLLNKKIVSKKNIGILIVMLVSTVGFGQVSENEVITVNENLRLIKLTDHVYIHESFHMSEEYGRLGSNGMILIDGDKAFLFDTAMTDAVTLQLLDYIEDSLKLKIVGFVTNDWHGDSMEGLELIKQREIKSYSNEMTKEITLEKGMPVPDIGFMDAMTIPFGRYHIICSYHGPAHTIDNIVVWIPEEKVLFADCMVKDIKSENLGFTGDGDLESYPQTLQKVRDSYPDALYVIPGHGKHGGIDLIDHTMELATK